MTLTRARKLASLAVVTATLAVGGCADLSDESLDQADQAISCDVAPSNSLESAGLFLSYERWYGEGAECLKNQLAVGVAAPSLVSRGMVLDPRDPTNRSYVKVIDLEANSTAAIATQFADIVGTANASFADVSVKDQVAAGLTDVLTKFKADLKGETWGPARYPNATDSGSVSKLRRVLRATPLRWFGDLEDTVIAKAQPLPVIVLPVYTVSPFAGGQISIGSGISIGYVHSANPYPSNVYLPYNSHGFGIVIHF